MRACSLVLLVALPSCVPAMEEAFVDSGAGEEHYFGLLKDGKHLLGVGLDPDGSLRATFSTANDDGTTPAKVCLEGWIKTALGTLEDDCYSQDVAILENGTFDTWVDVTDIVKAHISGAFSEDRETLDFRFDGVGSLTLMRE